MRWSKKTNLKICVYRVEKRTTAPGTWVLGSVEDCSFWALIFEDGCTDGAFQIGESRISKLLVKDAIRDEVVYNWDRGLDVQVTNPGYAGVVEFIVAELAATVFADIERPAKLPLFERFCSFINSL